MVNGLTRTGPPPPPCSVCLLRFAVVAEGLAWLWPRAPWVCLPS